MTGSLRVAIVFLMVAASMTLAGCGTTKPDVSGEWGGRLMLPDDNMADGVRDFDIAFDIDQSDDRDLSGTGELEAEFDEEEMRETVQITSGTIDDEGELRILFGTSSSMNSLEFNMSGQVDEDKITGTAFVQLDDGGSEAAFEMARGAEFGANPDGDSEQMKAVLRQDAAGDLEDVMEDYDEHRTEASDLLGNMEAVLAAYEEDLGMRQQALVNARKVLEEERANPTPEDAVSGVCSEFDGPEIYGPDGDPNNAMLTIEEELGEAVSFDGITDEPREAYPEIKSAMKEERDSLLETAEDYRDNFEEFRRAGGTPGEGDTPVEKDIVVIEEDAKEGARIVKQVLKSADSQRDDYVAQAEKATGELSEIYQELGCI